MCKILQFPRPRRQPLPADDHARLLPRSRLTCLERRTLRAALEDAAARAEAAGDDAAAAWFGARLASIENAAPRLTKGEAALLASLIGREAATSAFCAKWRAILRRDARKWARRAALGP